jgi:hypothetical protein
VDAGHRDARSVRGAQRGPSWRLTVADHRRGAFRDRWAIPSAVPSVIVGDDGAQVCLRRVARALSRRARPCRPARSVPRPALANRIRAEATHIYSSGMGRARPA